MESMLTCAIPVMAAAVWGVGLLCLCFFWSKVMGGCVQEKVLQASKQGIEQLLSVLAEPGTKAVFVHFPMSTAGYAAFLMAHQEGRSWFWWYNGKPTYAHVICLRWCRCTSCMPSCVEVSLCTSSVRSFYAAILCAPSVHPFCAPLLCISSVHPYVSH